MTRCLLLVGDRALGEALSLSLGGSGFEVDLHSRLDDASQSLTENFPDVILLETELGDRSGLEMLALADSLQLRAPALVLRPSRGWRRPPFPLSPLLSIYSLDAEEHAWRAPIDEALASAKGAAEGPMFRLTDYVQLAVSGEQSVALHGRLPGADDVLLEIVGGDVWNVYSGDTEGETALLSALPAAPRDVGVSWLRSVPRQRQIRGSGWDLLVECERKLSGAEQKQPAAAGTRPISFDELRTMVEEETAVSAEPADDGGSESFDELLERGFAAALARDYESAVGAFEKALELEPEDARVKFNLDRVRRRLGERGG